MWGWDNQTYQCVEILDPQRTVNHVAIVVDITSEFINGNYVVGYYFSGDPGQSCSTVYNHVLDNRTDPCSYPVTMALVYPGVYTFTFGSLINNPNCLLGVCTDRVLRTATIRVGESYVLP